MQKLPRMDRRTWVEAWDSRPSFAEHFTAGPDPLTEIGAAALHLPGVQPSVALSTCHGLPLAALLTPGCTRGEPGAF